MVWLVVVVAIVLVVLTVAAVLGRVDGALADPTSTMSHVPLPQDRLTPGDLDGVRFDTAMRGYRMSQVDATLDRLRREIAELQQQGAGLVRPAMVTGQDAVPVSEGTEPSGPPEPPELRTEAWHEVDAPDSVASTPTATPAPQQPAASREPS